MTLGTEADDSGLATVTGGGGVDTINAAVFAGALTVASGDGADEIITQSGDYNLSVDAGAGNDSITIVTNQLESLDTIDGGSVPIRSHLVNLRDRLLILTSATFRMSRNLQLLKVRIV